MTEENKNILAEALTQMCQAGVCLAQYQKTSAICPLTRVSALNCRNWRLHQRVTKGHWEGLIEETEKDA